MTDKQIARQIERYLQERDGEDEIVEFCMEQTNIQDAITVAVTSCNRDGKMYYHQWRLGKDLLARFLEVCLDHYREIDRARDFHTLYRIIESCRIPYIGKLTFYDVTHRIARYKGLFPNRIYLHAGTRIGAELLHGKIKGDTILKSQLRTPFHREDINEEDIEDILCHYIHKYIENQYKI